MSYKNPSLAELVAELRFEIGVLTHQKLFEIAGAVQTLGQSQVEFPNPGGVNLTVAPDGSIRPSGPKIFCWNVERTRLVQLQEGIVAVNHVGNYQGWDGFFDLFKSVHEAVLQVIPGVTPESIALNAVDRLLVPKSGYRLGKYLNCGGPFIPRELENCETACDLTMGRGILNVDSRNSVIVISSRINEANVMIQFNSVLQELTRSNFPVQEHIEQLHQSSNQRFEGLITDETRAFMGGEK